LSLAGVAHLTGSSLVVTLGLVFIAIVVLAMQVASMRETMRLASLVDETAVRSRVEIENLADRMWEMQESEERFHGLIDAHRDREGRVVYANRILSDLLGHRADALVGRTLAELGIDIGLVPDSAFSSGECLSSTDVAIRSETGLRWFSWIELSARDKSNNAV